MKQFSFAVAVGIVIVASACFPHRRALVVSDAELTGLSANDRSQIDAKAALLRTAADACAAKKAALVVAKRDVQMAALAISRDKAALDIAELKFQEAQETGNADTMLPAKKAREEASAQLDRSVAVRKYCEAKRDYLERTVAVGEAEIAAASANLELVKYESATRSKGGPDATALAEFKSQSATAGADLAEVQVSAAKAEAVMDAARTEN
jgi:hypothetical protein